MTIFYRDNPVVIHNGSEKSFKALQEICEYSAEIKDVCRNGVLIVFANTKEEIVPIEDLIFT